MMAELGLEQITIDRQVEATLAQLQQCDRS